jgi:hypothetical protein
VDGQEEVRQALARMGVELPTRGSLPVSPYVEVLPRAVEVLFSQRLAERPPAPVFAAPRPQA